MTLNRCAKNAGISYGGTAVDWANFHREIFKEYIQTVLPNIIFEGDVEIDESLFGRRCKYHRGNPNVGIKVWIFGIISRATNSIILYPVDNRDADTLIPIIKRHVAPGSRIFSDCWAAYRGLNSEGYEHFTVSHKTNFKAKYKNVETGEIIECCTNSIEGAWKHAKAHFRKINGCSLSTFGGHLSEIIWRNHVKNDNIFEAFYTQITSIYTLKDKCTFNYSTPLFPSWTGRDVAHKRMSVIPEHSDVDVNDSPVEENSSSSETSQVELPTRPSSRSVDEATNFKSVCKRFSEKMSTLLSGNSSTPSSDVKPFTSHPIDNNDLLITISSCEDDDSILASPIFGQKTNKRLNLLKRKNKAFTTKEGLTCPDEFRPIKKSKNITTLKNNPYTKSGFIWSESDSDFTN